MNENKGRNEDEEESNAPTQVAIEGKLPLTAIDIESQKDMSSGGSHPLLSLHKWFAARPTPASRAAVLGSVLPMGVDNDEFLKLMQIGPKGMESGISRHLEKKFSESKNGKSNEEHYAYPDPTTQKPTVSQLEEFHNKIRKSWGGSLPTILDPTSGRGIIPFEALRYDLPTRANELNPVAYLITKTGLEYAAKVGSLESELKKYRDKIHERAKENIAQYYPTEESDREILNSAFTYILKCGSCGGEVPLVRNWWINKQSGDVIKPIYMDNAVEFEHIDLDVDSLDNFDPDNGPVSRGGAECPYCNVPKQTSEIREEIREDEFEYRIYAVSYEDHQGEWGYRAGTKSDLEGLEKATERVNSDFGMIDFLTEPIHSGFNTSQIKRYGMDEWRDIFTPRQLVTHYEYLDAFKHYSSEIMEKFGDEKSEAILTILALSSSRTVEFNCRLAKWRIRRGTGSRIFTDNNLAIKFTAVDNNISANRRGYIDRSEQVIDKYEDLVSYLPEDPDIDLASLDAANLTHEWAPGSVDAAIIDPPYYSSIQYS